MSPDPRILVVRFSSLGDVVLTTPLLRAIKRRHPPARITFVTKSAYAPLVAGNPCVDRIEALLPGESVSSLSGRLISADFDYQLDLHGNFRSLCLRKLLGGRWSKYRKRRAKRVALVWLGVDLYGPSRSVAERYFDAAARLDVVPDGDPPDVFPSPRDRARAKQVAPENFVVLTPGARHATKRWPPHLWHDLALRLRSRGYSVVAVGAPHERDLLRGPGITEAYGLGLGTVAALLQLARAAVTNDSGVMHLATAARCRVVAMFGPTVKQFGFFPYNGRSVVLERQLSCRPCSPLGADRCPLGHHSCMVDIRPKAVVEAVEATA